MKIYSYIRIDKNGNIIEEISEEYSGDIALCKGPRVPGPTEEEREIQRKILEQMEESDELRDALLPFMLESTGYRYDDEGNIVKMTHEEFMETLDPIQKQQYENLQLIQEKMAQALRGELPVSEELEAGIAKREKQMQESLARRLGPGWQETSAGIQAQAKFAETAEMLREAARRGMTAEYGQLGYQGAQTYGLTPQTPMMQAGGVTGYSTSLIPTFQSALTPYQQQRQMQFQASQQRSQNINQMMSSFFGAAGTGFGTMAGYGMFK